MANAEGPVHPLFLKLQGRQVLVVGAGPVGERKVAGLLAAKARIRVVAPEATEGVARWAREGAVTWSARPFEERDVEGCWLVFAATPHATVQRSVAEACEARHIFLVAVDDPGHASAYSGAIVERAPFTVAFSSGGATPALTRLLREILEEVLPGEEWVERARRLRAQWKADGTPMGERFGQLVRELKRDA